MKTNFIPISKNILYYQYDMSRALSKFLSFLSHWGGCDNLLKIAGFWKKKCPPSAIMYTWQSFACKKIIMVKIFKYMHIVSWEKKLYMVCTHKAHFWTHKYRVWIFKKHEFWQKFNFSVSVPCVCISYMKFCEKTEVI